MFGQQSQITLAPLTESMSSKVKFNWTKIEQQVFEEIKQIVACNILLSYTYFNRELKINNDARRFQLGAVIGQDVKPITFYSKKTNWYPNEENNKRKVTVKHYINIKNNLELYYLVKLKNLY